MRRIYLIMALISTMMVSCVPDAEKATVETREVTDVTSNSARVVCNVSDDGGAEVSSRGVCWDTSDNPTIETASSMGAGSGIGDYECEIEGLESNTTYYVRAYATNEKGMSYGEEVSFNTLDGNNGDDYVSDGEIAGHGYVDLGLPSGLKWATCNVGASSPEDYGDYFAWGETTTKSEYTEDNSATYGQQMNDISGNTQYDAASANWGGSWRTPTKEEMHELLDHCEWDWTQVNGVLGSKFIGYNGNSIFLPAAGLCNVSSFDGVGNTGFYWSSTPEELYDMQAYGLVFYSVEDVVGCYGRASGLSIRPVSE